MFICSYERLARSWYAHSPDQVHAEQPFRLVLVRLQPGPDGLVADAEAVLVGAHLGAPHPGGAAQHHGVGGRRLVDGDVGALHVESGR